MISIAFPPLEIDGLPPVPPDIQQCAQLFRANCGPISIAAVFGTTVIEVIKFFPQFPGRDYTTAADMAYSLSCTGVKTTRMNGLPTDGVVLIQLDGPWTQGGSPERAQLPYTHWVACRNDYIYDVNVGDWLESSEWHTRGAQSWISGVRKSTGFHLRTAFSISPEPFNFSPFGRVPLRSSR